MSRIALIVDYESHPGMEAEFDAVIRHHAKRCLLEEPGGCLRFEVLRPLDEHGAPLPNRFMANEVFADHAALLAHRATPRFARISEEFRRLLASRRPIVCDTDA